MATETAKHKGTAQWIAETQTVEMGPDTVILDKMFGPTIFADLRITADPQRGWVIERQWIANVHEDEKWVEWCVIPHQIDAEFPKDDE